MTAELAHSGEPRLVNDDPTSKNLSGLNLGRCIHRGFFVPERKFRDWSRNFLKSDVLFDGQFRHCLSEPHCEMRLNGQNNVMKKQLTHLNTTEIAFMKTNSASRAVRFNVGVVLGLALCSIGVLRASAQISGTGFPGNIPMWTGSSTMGASFLNQDTTTHQLTVGLSTAGAPFNSLNTGAAGDGYGVLGSTSTATGAGVLGETQSPNANGVRGTNTATTGLAWGMIGQSVSSTGIAVEVGPVPRPGLTLES
jgi:hypothetical protein